ncbi:hypothetical protein [Streptomyces canus]|uniref:hypothetical protein n=1 Tax=Streptomyces canus TaxID=58343 RepID=UPI0033A69A61
MSSSNVVSLSRITPLMGPAAYKTYAVVSPLSTHWRPATCAEVDCPHFLNGWRTRIENLTPELLHTARTARFLVNGRNVPYRYTVARVAEGESYLVFEAGQPCFAAGSHSKQVGREPLYIVRDGDWRGNPRRTRARQHLNPATWVEDFSEHQQKLADEIKKG